MSKLIRNWEELSKVPSNDKYRIVVKDYSGWIIPVTDEFGEDNCIVCNCDKPDEFYRNHIYLSTHTFYGTNYKKSTELLQDHGFDIEIDNWDKE